MVVGALFSIGVATASGVVAYALSAREPQFAEVLTVQPIKEVIKTPRNVCKDVAVTYPHLVKDQDRIAEAAVNTEVGGVERSASRKNQERPPLKDFFTVTETRCSTIIDISEKVVAYEIKYLINGTVKQMRMNRDPGNQIPVMGNQLVLAGDSITVQ
ncbi:uncharacterized protein YcfJ [Pseudomonas duriflava]|uniref:Uncharacterized protein YcfJ n=2 Tax=Pseudomonas duriflava TaxID=459528 RepID=A0A562QQI4_9PSED|nr:uncharacterized protein YcfJ [Pseudomonas duriflava]